VNCFQTNPEIWFSLNENSQGDFEGHGGLKLTAKRKCARLPVAQHKLLGDRQKDSLAAEIAT